MSSSRSTASTDFNAQLAPFAQDAWTRFPASARNLEGRDLQEVVENWARAEARAFFHLANRQYQFVRIYSALARFANVQIGLQQQRGEWVQAVKETRRRDGGTFVQAMKTTSAEHFQNKLQEYARVAWTRYNPSQTDISNWARTEARNFYHISGGKMPFITAWRTLVEYGETLEANGYPEQRDIRQEAAEDFAPASEDARVTSFFTADGEQTDAERRAGRNALNRILFRERELWWDAFAAEASEDMDEDAPTASQRFAWHCATILNRRTGLRRNLIAPVVEGWAEAHA